MTDKTSSLSSSRDMAAQLINIERRISCYSCLQRNPRHSRINSEAMPRHLITLSAIVCLIGSVVFLLTRQSFQLSIPTSSSNGDIKEPFSLAAFYSNVPYTSTWQSWWHPQRPVQSWKDFIDGKWNLFIITWEEMALGLRRLMESCLAGSWCQKGVRSSKYTW